jgi:hypothetical protein
MKPKSIRNVVNLLQLRHSSTLIASNTANNVFISRLEAADPGASEPGMRSKRSSIVVYPDSNIVLQKLQDH